MIKPLRKYHFWLWRSLAVILPVILVSAILVRPGERKTTPSLNDIEFSYSIHSDTTFTILLQVTNPPAAPSCLAFSEYNGIATLLGDVHTRGRYTFVVSRKSTHIILRDVVHRKNIITYPLKQL